MMAKKNQRTAASQRRRKEKQQREWEKMNEDTPQLKNIPPSTSKFALAVIKEVFKALVIHDIKFKAEFNYLGHRLYHKAINSAECGLRADLLVEVELQDRKKPLTIVIEAQG